jgi:4-hydroxy-tetrahydrodipicolinate synthase
MVDLRGVNVAMCTPLDQSGERVDEGRLKEHIDYLIDAGVHGIVLNAGTGEFAYLRDAESMRVTEVGAAHIAGRVNVITQPSAVGLSETIERSKMAVDFGADALMVLPPWLESPFERGIMYHYEQLARAVDATIVLYQIPDATGVEITPDMYRRLVAIDNISYVKDSTGDLARMQKLASISGGGVLGGADPVAPFAIMAGAVGWIWGAANVMPHECVRLYEFLTTGKLIEALELWSLMAPANLFFWENDLDAEYLAAVKTATAMVGHDVGESRRPQLPLTSQARVALQAALSTLPFNTIDRDRLIWREWADERDWLVQMTSHLDQEQT